MDTFYAGTGEETRIMARKSRLEGTVIEVGWKDNTTHTVRNYALIEVKLTSERRKDVAEKKLKEYQGLVGKRVSMFVEN